MAYIQQLFSDHSVQVPVGPAGTTIKVVDGDTVYYGGDWQVGASNNNGSLSNGQSTTVTGAGPLWVRSLSASDLSVSVTASEIPVNELPTSVVNTGSAAPGTGNTGDWYIVRSDGTIQRFTPQAIDASAWGVSPSASYTANTTNINAAITAAVGYATVSGTGVARLRLPPGLISTSGGHTDGGTCLLLEGAGQGRTVLQVNAAATTGVDVLTLSGTYSAVQDLTIDGNRINIASGDCLVLNGVYTTARRIDARYAGANGITLGKAASAEGARLSDIRIRYCLAYGLQVAFNGGWSTHDCQIDKVDIGQSGKSGVRLDDGGQQLVHVHSWGNGIYTELGGGTDSAGFYVNSSDNEFTGCESETNNSYGLNNGGLRTKWTGGSIWGNYLSGVHSTAAGHRLALSGAQIYRNGIGAGTSSAYVGVENGSQFCAIGGNSIFDDGLTVAAGSYSGFTPTFAFPGRTAIYTQYQAYQETGSADYNTLSGNTMRGEDTRSGTPYTVLGTHTIIAPNNQLGQNQFSYQLHPDQLASGEWTIGRDSAVSNSGSPASGEEWWAYFTAQRTETVTQIGVLTGSAGASGLTLCRYSLCTVAANGDVTQVASTVSDTTLLAAAATMYFKALQANYTLVAGQRYAVGVIQVGTTPAKLQGAFSTRGNISPRLHGKITGQTDLVASQAASGMTNQGYRFYAEVTP